MIKALRLACIPRLFAPGRKNWNTVPGYNLRRHGGLGFLFRCNCDTKYIEGLPSFHKDIFKFFNELITLHYYDGEQDMSSFWIIKKFSLEESPYSLANGLTTIFCLYKTCWIAMARLCFLTKNLRTNSLAKRTSSNFIKL